MRITECKGTKVDTWLVCLHHSGLTTVEEKEVGLRGMQAHVGQSLVGKSNNLFYFTLNAMV